jgi:cytochrome c nitrite reductase small subunit
MSRSFLIILGITVGIFIGIGAYTFLYAKGYSYLTDNPDACANCHSMTPQFSGWIKSSHRSVAVCNDCHTPKGMISKYYTKASNGFWHSFYFTTGWYPDNIEITQRNIEITENACMKCHQDIVDMMKGSQNMEGERIPCIKCHTSVGHLE